MTFLFFPPDADKSVAIWQGKLTILLAGIYSTSCLKAAVFPHTHVHTRRQIKSQAASHLGNSLLVSGQLILVNRKKSLLALHPMKTLKANCTVKPDELNTGILTFFGASRSLSHQLPRFGGIKHDCMADTILENNMHNEASIFYRFFNITTEF